MEAMEYSNQLASRGVNLGLSDTEKRLIRNFKIRDKICESGIFTLTLMSALIIIFIFIFILIKSWDTFKYNGISFIFTQGFDKQLQEAYNAPAGQQSWEFGALGLIIGTLATTLGALVIAIPTGLGTAIVIAELAPLWIRKFLLSVVRLLASIPSIIYGLIGLMLVVPFIQNNLVTTQMQIDYIQYFQLTGKSMLAGILVLSFMIAPIIIALSVDAINAVPKKYKEASLALGLSYWRTIIKVVIPAAKSGILAGVILATGRAVGEAIALSMVTGGIGNLPNPSHGFVSLLTPVLPLASAIINKSETMAVPSIESALFACGFVLLLTCTMLSLFTRVVESFVKRREGIE